MRYKVRLELDATNFYVSKEVDIVASNEEKALAKGIELIHNWEATQKLEIEKIPMRVEALII